MNRRRGFTLTEVLMTLSLLGTASLIAGYLFFASMKTMNRQGETANAQAAADHADSLLRRDVWSATRIDDSISGRLTLEMRGSAPVSWASQGGQLTRIAASSTQCWPSESLHFRADRAGLVLEDAQGQPLRVFLCPTQQEGTKP